MPKKAQVHTPATLKKLQPPEQGIRRVAVGGVPGLELQISATNARSWVLRGVFLGQRVNRGLGSTDDLSLADAREEARRIRAAWRDGADPSEQRRQAVRAAMVAQQRRITFGEYCPPAVATLTAGLNKKSPAQWAASIEAYAMPVLRDIPIAEVSVADITAVLQPIWNAKADTAGKLRGRLENIIARATAEGLREAANPAERRLVAAVLGRQQAVTENHPAIDWRDAAEFWAGLGQRVGAGAQALRLITLTATRSNEVRGATWAEINLDDRIWRIPAERTKTKKLYRIPLTPAAMRVIGEPSRADAPLFGNTRGDALSDAAVSKIMRGITEDRFLDPDTQKPGVVHGLRATFRSWAQDHSVDGDLAEQCLGHLPGNAAEQAYRRSDVIEARRDVLTQWANHLEGKQ